MSPPALCFGAAFVGLDPATPQALISLLSSLTRLSITRIDTARRYPSSSPGKSETLLGEVKASERGFVIDTKIKVPGTGAAGSLTRENILKSVEESLGALEMENVNVLYCHAPDPDTPIEETASAFNEVYRQGKFKKLGLSNYTADQVEAFMAVCAEKQFVKPSVYQGEYNPLYRLAEETIFLTLRKHGMVFNAYSPLAGGYLAKPPTSIQIPPATTTTDNPRSAHPSRYDKPAIREAIRIFDDFITAHGLTLKEVALRWMAWHSALGEGDAMLLGGRGEMLDGNVQDVRKGRLDSGVVEAVQQMWETMKTEVGVA